MAKFIALRRTPRVATLGLRSAPVADRRLTLAADAPRSGRAAALRRLGLEQIEPTEQGAQPRQGFQRLGHVGAYVVDAPNEEGAARAREVLEPDYHLMPNIPLALPRPLLAAGRLQIGRRRAFWPAESGVRAAHRAGVTGRGVLVGVLDSGCDADHREFARKRIEFRYVPLDPNPDKMRATRGFDVDGHGTHVCGIIAGRQVGVAPDAELLVASVIESETVRTSLERIVIALDWMLQHFQEPRHASKPMIVSMSLGFRPEWVEAAELQAAMDGIRLLLTTLVTDFAILPVVAIGNDGPGIMRAPAYFPEALAVGAVDFAGAPAPFSGGGVSPFTGAPEPDIVGYGVDVVSGQERDADGHSWYARMSGSSMATPYVAGIAALLASANPGLQGQALRDRVVADALALGAGPERVGAGLARIA